jgi:hypothetical protein
MNLPEVVEAVQEGCFVAQENSAVFSFWNVDLRPGAHITQSLVRESEPVVQSGSSNKKHLSYHFIFLFIYNLNQQSEFTFYKLKL